MPARKWPTTSVTGRNSPHGGSCGSTWPRLRRFDTLAAHAKGSPNVRAHSCFFNLCDLQGAISSSQLNIVSSRGTCVGSEAQLHFLYPATNTNFCSCILNSHVRKVKKSLWRPPLQTEICMKSTQGEQQVL